MIIYDSNYRFVGVTSSTIKKLNYPSFWAFKNKINNDFADLFIRKNGFIYKFNYLSWIDYILQNPNNSNAIVKAGDNHYYKLTFTIEPCYFFENDKKGYLLNISSMTEFKIDEDELEEIEANSNNPDDLLKNQEGFNKNEFEIVSEAKLFKFTDEDLKQHEENEFHYDYQDDFVLPEIKQEIFSDVQHEQIKDVNSDLENIEKSEKVPDDHFLPSTDDFLEEFRNSNSTFNSNKLESFSFNNASKSNNPQDFSTNYYPIDEVSQELKISSEALISFLSDFIHLINHLKDYIYASLEGNQIQNVQKVVFMVKGLARNLRISDIYEELKKVCDNNYFEIGELTKDINHIYSLVDNFSNKLNNVLLNKTNNELRISTSSLNKAHIPDILFQDLLDSFIKLFDHYKEEIEGSLNPEKVSRLIELIEQLNNVGQNLSIKEISEPLTGILEKLKSKDDIVFEKIIINWLELATFVEALERKK